MGLAALIRRKEVRMNLHQRTILITGGTSGIGLALARQLLQRGNTLIVTGRDQARLNAAERALPGAHLFRSDLGDPEAITALRDAVLARFPALDTVINNAGIMRNLKLAEAGGAENVTLEIATNLCGPVLMVQHFLPQLLSRPDALIVNVSSGLAFLPFPAAPIYCATKAAMHSYTQSLRVQLASTSVTVVELAPPSTETPLFRGEFAAEMKHEKAMAPEELARRAIAGIEAGKLEVRPGVANLLRMMSRIAPGFMLRQMTRLANPK